MNVDLPGNSQISRNQQNISVSTSYFEAQVEKSDMLNFEKSEFSLTPKAVIVHDPTEFNVFAHFENLPIQEIQEKFLFREIPDVKQFRFAHQIFFNSLKKELKTFSVRDIIKLKGETISKQFNSYLSTNPNLVYTRDSIITLPWLPDSYIVGRMVKKIRQKEPELMSYVAKLLGLKPILEIPEGLFLEGGDVIPICHKQKKYLVVGYGRRTTRETLDFLLSELLPKGIIDGIIGIELAQWRINLDGGMVPYHRVLNRAVWSSLAASRVLPQIPVISQLDIYLLQFSSGFMDFSVLFLKSDRP